MNSVLETYRKDNSTSRELAKSALQWIRRLAADKTLADQVRRAAELTLRRSALNRADEPVIREEAQSLLNLLETTDHHESPQEMLPTIGRPEIETETKTEPSAE